MAFVSYADRLDEAAVAYRKFTTGAELSVALSLVEKTLEELNKSIKSATAVETVELMTKLANNGNALKMRLNCKLLMAEYAAELGSDEGEKVIAFVDEILPKARESGYKNTVAALEGSKALVLAASDYIKQMAELFVLVNSGNTLTSSSADVIEKAKSIVDGAAVDERLSSPFGKGVSFPDISAAVTDRLSLRCGEVESVCMISLEACVPCKKLDYSDGTLMPEPDCDEGGKARAMVLCTPFNEEARLAAAYYVDGNKSLYEYDASLSSSADDVDTAFTFIKYKSDITVITGMDSQSDEMARYILFRAMEICKSSPRRIFAVDGYADRLYNMGVALACERDGYSVLDISQTYLTMPDFSQTVSYLTDAGFPDADTDTLRKMPFLGFAGLNALSRLARKADWIDRGKQLSLANEPAAGKYLMRLDTPSLFIDDGWGDFRDGTRNITDTNGEFDYDDIDDVHISYVKRIVESGISVFAICGSIARYCTTGTGDMTVWSSLSREEMERRVTLAVKLVLKSLRVPVNPQVEILDTLDNDSAGGTCFDGGKRIVFKYKDCLNLQWMRDAIVHECFHALQAKLMREWSPWYYDNMGITYGRTRKWKDTRAIYDENTKSKVYKVHMYEGDAYAFEIDCRRGMEGSWNSIDFD